MDNSEEAPPAREPCPWRIVDDCGSAFAMGSIGGGIWHSVKGYRNSPPRFKVQGMMEAVKLNGPRIGGQFAVWGLMFSSFDCSLLYLRNGTEDPWNSITAGFLTGGALAVRNGPRVALGSACFGGVILALIEGMQIGLAKMTHEQMSPAAQQQQVLDTIPADPLGPSPSAYTPPSMPAPPMASPVPGMSSGGGSESSSGGWDATGSSDWKTGQNA